MQYFPRKKYLNIQNQGENQPNLLTDHFHKTNLCSSYSTRISNQQEIKSGLQHKETIYHT